MKNNQVFMKILILKLMIKKLNTLMVIYQILCKVMNNHF